MATTEGEQPLPASVRVYFKQPDGSYVDGGISYELSQFGGCVPSAGDTIISPGVLVGLDRFTLINREFWTVEGRVFGALDLLDSIALLVQARMPEPHESVFVTG